jgi:hypothetical protein
MLKDVCQKVYKLLLCFLFWHGIMLPSYSFHWVNVSYVMDLYD